MDFLIPFLMFIVCGKCRGQQCQIRVPSLEVPSMTHMPTWQHFLKVRLWRICVENWVEQVFVTQKHAYQNLIIEDMLLPRD